MKRKVAVILIALVLAAATLLCGCNEIEKGESTWTPSQAYPPSVSSEKYWVWHSSS